MPTLELTQEEWSQLTTILAEVPWKVANPILYKMAHQAREQMQAPAALDQSEVLPDVSASIKRHTAR